MRTRCCKGKPSLVVEVVDLGHVAEQNALFVLEGDWDEVRHAGIVHLISVTLKPTHARQFKTITVTNHAIFSNFLPLDLGFGVNAGEFLLFMLC